MTAAVAPPPVVPFDLSCKLCRQNLRGRAATAACPQCGIAVSRSYFPELLHFTPPDVRQRLARAHAVLAAAPLAAILVGIAALVIIDRTAPRGGVSDPPMAIFDACAFSLCAGALVHAWGVWRLAFAMPENSIGRTSARMAVVITRLLAPLTALAMLATAGAWAWLTYQAGPSLSEGAVAPVLLTSVGAMAIWGALITTSAILIARLFELSGDHTWRARSAGFASQAALGMTLALVIAPIAGIVMIYLTRLSLRMRKTLRSLPPPPESAAPTPQPSP